MIARTVLFAAFVACVSASGTVKLPCGKCGVCCLPGWTLEEVSDTCINDADPSDTCFLCDPADPGVRACKDEETVRLIDTIGDGSVQGATSGGGVSVGSTLRNPSRGFLDTTLTDSTFNYFFDWQIGAMSTSYETATGADLRVTYNCKRVAGYYGANACDLFFFVFRCHNCPTTNSGPLHAYLTSQGWKVHGCGPKFKLSTYGTEHPMITYHKETTTELEVVEPGFELNFVFAAVGAKDKLCSDINDQYVCQNTDSCSWDANGLNGNGDYGTCTTGWCPKRAYTGPVMGCQVCPMDNYGGLVLD